MVKYFGSSGVRGLINFDVTPVLVRKVGLAASLYSKAIKANSTILGGDPCGAWIHPQFYYCPDGNVSAALLLEALEKENKSLRDFIAEVSEYITLRENIACSNYLKSKAISGIVEEIRPNFQECTDFSTVDGIRLSLKNGWLLIRAAGTEPLIRLTVEGESLKAAKDIMEKVKDLVIKIVEDRKK